VRRTGVDGAPAYFIESTAPRYFGTTSVAVSQQLAQLLLHDKDLSMSELIHALGDPSARSQLAEELFELWAARAIRLSPDTKRAAPY
jgi:hypothetical protein